MVCKQCGAQIPDDAKFCTSCGCAYESVAPQQQEPVAVPDVITCPKKKENKFVKAFLSILCCIVIFIFSFSALTIMTARDSISDDKIESFLDDVDIESIVGNTSFDGLLSQELSSKDIAKIYRKTTIKDYVQDVTQDYAGYLLGGSKPDGVEADDIISLMEENEYVIEEIIGDSITDADYEATYKFFDEDGEENLGVLSSEVRTNDALDIVRMIISVYVIIALVALAILFIVLLFKSRRWNSDSLVWVASSFIVSAVVFIVLGAVKPVVLSLISGFDSIIVELVSGFMSNILGTVLINSSILIVVAVVLILINVLIKKIKSKKA